MANLKVLDGDGSAKYLKANEAGTDEAPFIPHHKAELYVGGAAVGGGNPVPISDNSGAITVDGTVTANAGSGPFPVSDNGGSLTVDGTVTANLAAGANNIGDVDVLTVPAPLSTTGGGTEAAALRVTIANDSTGVVSVDDNGGSLTVDGTVTVGAITAGDNNIGNVDVLTIAAGDNNIGNVDVVTVPTDPFGANADAASATGSISAKLRYLAGTGIAGMTALPSGSNAIGKLAANSGVDIGDVDVTSVAGMPTGASATQVQGTVAAGSAAANNPLHNGVKGVDTIPAAVDANDITSQLGDLHGRTLVAIEAPNGALSVASTATITDTTVTQVLAAAGASTKWRITAIGVYNSDATVGTWVKIQDDSGTPVVYWRGYCAPAGGGFNLNFTPALPAAGQANGKINVVAETTSAEIGCTVCAYKVPS